MQLMLSFSLFASLAAAQTLKASFTRYGLGDGNNSPTCKRTSVACGYYSDGGYYAAISQNYYGGATNTGPGYACEQCWLLIPQTDQNGNKLTNANSIVVKINDLCPIEGNTPCAMQSQSDVNYLGANVNFDTCMDDGASAALFGPSGPYLAIGTAQRVSCSTWSYSNPCYGNCTYFPGDPPTGAASAATTARSTLASNPSPCSSPAPIYSQCAGQGYTGSTCCTTGTTCQYQNQYYSQCLPPQKKVRFARGQ